MNYVVVLRKIYNADFELLSIKIMRNKMKKRTGNMYKELTMMKRHLQHSSIQSDFFCSRQAAAACKAESNKVKSDE